MSLTIQLPPEEEQTLKAHAEAQGLSPEDYILRAVSRQLREEEAPTAAEGNLLQFFRRSPLVGLDLEFERDQDHGRDVSL